MTIDLANIIFSPMYTIGHWIGTIVAGLIQFAFGVALPDIMVDTIGVLAMMTGLLKLADLGKKIAWGVVTICWALVIMRIGILTLGH